MKKILLILIIILAGVGVYYFFGKTYNTQPADQFQAPNQELFKNGQEQNNIVGMINIKNFSFDPATITIKTGTTITWTNEDSAPHDVISEGNEILKIPIMNKGEKYSFTFTGKGEYNYYCSIHPSMKGKIIVE